MTSKIIMLTGDVGTERTTAASILFKYGFDIITFAEPIKRFAVSVGFNPDHVYGTPEQEKIIDPIYKISPYEFMQRFGVSKSHDEIPKEIKNIDLDNHDILTRTIEHNLSNNNLLCIDDDTISDKTDIIHKYNGIIIKLIHDTHKFEYSDSEDDDSGEDIIASNASNDSTVKYDYVLYINDNIEQLENELRWVLIKEGIYDPNYFSLSYNQKMSLFIICAVVFFEYLLFYIN